MTRILLIILLLLFFLFENINGQEFRDFDIRIKVHPTALISIPRPTVQVGMELKYRKIGVDLSYGQQYAFLLSSDPDTIRVNNFGNRFRVDLKYYLNPLKSDILLFPFISFGYCKIYSTQNLTTDWFSGYKFEPSIGRVINIQVFSANFGVIKYYKRFFFESILGTGIRFRKVQNVDVNGSILSERKQILPHFGVGVRIGYRINIL